MWTYNNTDELYYTNMYKNMSKKSNHELYHSDIYLGKDFSDGIKHWKYIKREKVNGKWRYYYKDSKLNDLKEQYDQDADLARASSELSKYYKNNPKARSSEYAPQMHDYIDTKIQNRALYSSYKYNNEKVSSDKRKAKYEKYLIKPLNKVSDAIYKGKQKIKNVLSKINKKYKIVSTHHERTITRNRSKKI